MPWAHGAFMLFRRSAFDAVGGFDERQWMYAEDIDIAWRLAEAGLGIGYEPAARVRHAGSAAAVQAFGDERSARHIRAVYAWMARRRGLRPRPRLRARQHDRLGAALGCSPSPGGSQVSTGRRTGSRCSAPM